MSLQTKSRQSFRTWKEAVRGEAAKAWAGRRMIEDGDLSLTLVYLYRAGPVDVDNIIKPIQDALEGIVLSNDILVTDVECHRRVVPGRFKLKRVPPLLAFALASARDCVYVRLGEALALEDSL
jgi:Holliday junction resolvase RusA-like endonuclease